MRYKNRAEAARLLAKGLSPYRFDHPLVLGVPRGGVPMARIIADALDGDVDVVLVRKLRAPGQPEVAIGAIDESGAVLKGEYFDIASDDYVREESALSRKSSATGGNSTRGRPVLRGVFGGDRRHGRGGAVASGRQTAEGSGHEPPPQAPHRSGPFRRVSEAAPHARWSQAEPSLDVLKSQTRDK
ncbi:MAG: phosphoribosyltransferase family protein [Vicinamibacterales bacterium]